MHVRHQDRSSGPASSKVFSHAGAERQFLCRTLHQFRHSVQSRSRSGSCSTRAWGHELRRKPTFIVGSLFIHQVVMHWFNFLQYLQHSIAAENPSHKQFQCDLFVPHPPRLRSVEELHLAFVGRCRDVAIATLTSQVIPLYSSSCTLRW